MTKLCDLARHYGSDKCKFYTPLYDRLFSAKRESVRRVLEIGIGHPDLMQGYVDELGLTYETGASLKMWRDYFPNAHIYGLDVNPDSFVNEGRIHSMFVDQRDADSLYLVSAYLGGNFNLIVEDGLHVVDAQLRTAREFIPLLAQDGIYIIEDICTPDEAAFLESQLPYPSQVVEFGEARILVLGKEPRI
jgi:hypothetical protein